MISSAGGSMAATGRPLTAQAAPAGAMATTRPTSTIPVAAASRSPGTARRLSAIHDASRFTTAARAP